MKAWKKNLNKTALNLCPKQKTEIDDHIPPLNSGDNNPRA
jgi:hypothetical protein